MCRIVPDFHRSVPALNESGHAGNSESGVPSVFAFNWIPCHGYANIFNFKCRFCTRVPAFSCRSFHLYTSTKKNSVESRKIFLQFMIKPERIPRDALKKTHTHTHFFFKSSRNIRDARHKTATWGNERVEARSDRISHAPEPPQRAFRRDTNHREQITT